ncbi:HNH endonuclease [Gehongia tenuis]|nr:HNH endonuclease signature motif containing protein [Gehongia tenuis]
MAKDFYHEAVWKRLREQALIRDHYLCQRCLLSGKLKRATTVHHVCPVDRYPAQALDIGNLQSVCAQCHNQLHPNRGQGAADGPCSWDGVRVIKP